MNEQEIVKLFLQHGFQLSHDSLPLIKNKPEEILSMVEKIKPRPFIITKKNIEKIIEVYDEKKIPKIVLLKKIEFEKKTLRVEDYVNHFTENYENIKKILIKNTKLHKIISVNKITNNIKEFSLIAIVRDKGINNLLVEDTTGEIHVFFEEKIKNKFDSIELDDIIGFLCMKEKDKIFVKDIFYPDISITREINKTNDEIRIFYIYKPSLLCDEDFGKISDVLKKTGNKDSIFVYGEWEDKETLKNFDNLFLISENSSPMIFQLQNIKILTLSKTYSPKNILDKRLIKNSNLLNIFAIDDIPDIIFSSDKKTYFKNYKGITIISNIEQKKYFVINLRTREVEEKLIIE